MCVNSISYVRIKLDCWPAWRAHYDYDFFRHFRAVWSTYISWDFQNCYLERMHEEGENPYSQNGRLAVSKFRLGEKTMLLTAMEHLTR